MATPAAPERRLHGAVAVRLALAGFVLAWLFSARLREIPFWVPFLVALGLELQFFLVRRESRSARTRADRLPQAVDRAELGYGGGTGELLLVRDPQEDLWVPYAGEQEDELDELIERERAEAGERPAAPVGRAAPARPWRQLATGIGVIAVLAAVVWVADRRGGWDSLSTDARAAAVQRFSTEASRIVGRPVEIRCDESGRHVGAVQHADGVAQVGGNLAYLTPERCDDLYRLAFRDQVRFSQTARSIAVLAHEAWHLRGVRDEGATECYAFQSGVGLGNRLGLSEDTARQMMRQQLVENDLRLGASAGYRVPPGCRNDGPLDLDRRSDAFP